MEEGPRNVTTYTAYSSMASALLYCTVFGCTLYNFTKQDSCTMIQAFMRHTDNPYYPLAFVCTSATHRAFVQHCKYGMLRYNIASLVYYARAYSAVVILRDT